MFDEALDLAYEQVTHSLKLLWRRYIDEAANYIIQPRDGANTGTHHNAGLRHGHRVLGTNREFWVNTKTNISQWTRPYHTRMFRIQDIEIETFVQILIHKDIFPYRLDRYCLFYIFIALSNYYYCSQSPLLEFLFVCKGFVAECRYVLQTNYG